TSTWCGPDSQGNWFSMNYYCLVGSSLINALQLHTYVYPSTDKNIGEPTISGSDGRWNANTLSVGTWNGHALASSNQTTGDNVYQGYVLSVSENWNDPAFAPPSQSKFCGWECPLEDHNT